MPNTFAPRAYQNLVKARTRQLRLSHDGDAGDVKEWHAMVDMLDDEYTAEFLDEYSTPGDIPQVVSGVPDTGE